MANKILTAIEKEAGQFTRTLEHYKKISALKSLDGLTKEEIIDIIKSGRAKEYHWYEVDLELLDLKGVDFSGCYINYCHLDYIDFSGAQFKGTYMHGSTMKGCNFAGADMKFWNVNESSLERSRFNGANMERCFIWKSFGGNWLEKGVNIPQFYIDLYGLDTKEVK